jgi:peptidoglycan/LPS O-acetylase OafA/YrhL
MFSCSHHAVWTAFFSGPGWHWRWPTQAMNASSNGGLAGLLPSHWLLFWLPLLEYKVFTFSVLFASGLALMFKRDWLSRWLDRPLLRALGRYSYGIYMYHMVMLYCITALLHTSKLLAHIPGWLTKSILSLLIIAITGLIAFLSYRFFESFFLGLKSKWPEGEACLRISTKIAPSEGAMCLTARLPTGLSTENPLV